MDKLALNKKNKVGLCKQGFTLVEILVALAIFTIFITIALSALIVSNSSSKKATNIKTATDNVQYAMETFSRNARLGSVYTCLPANPPGIQISSTNGSNCIFPNVGHGVAFFVLDPTFTPNQTDVYAYYLENLYGNGRIIRCVERNIASGGVLPPIYIMAMNDCAPLTADEIDIDNFVIEVDGAETTDQKQPGIKVKISGNILINEESTPFALQTFISQRQYE